MKRPLLALAFALGATCAVCSVAAAQAEDGTEEGADKEKKDEGPSTIKTLAAFGLTLAGLVIVMLPVAKTMSSSYSYQQAKLMLINLLRTNPNQAEMMAKKMEGTFCEAIAMAMKVGGAGGMQDPAMIAQATKPTYDGVATGISAKWKGDIGKAKVGVMAAVAGAGVGIAGGALFAIPIIIAVLAILAFGKLMLFKHELDTSIVRARAEILPEVDGAIASGRYVAPRPPGT